MENIFVILFGLIFLLVGVTLIKDFFKKRKLISDSTTVIVEGVIINYWKEKIDKGKYYPTYEFIYNGERKTHNSRYGSHSKKLGLRQELYYNPNTGDVFSKKNSNTDIIFGICCTVFGLIAFLSFFM